MANRIWAFTIAQPQEAPMFFRTFIPILVAPLLALMLLSPAGPARADQLQCNSLSDAQRAVGLLVSGSFMIDFCSLCDSKVKVVRVAQAEVVKGCRWEVSVRGTVIAISSLSFERGKGVGSAKFNRADIPYAGRIDLAYAYVEEGKNKFNWIGGVVGLNTRPPFAEVNVATLKLPVDIYDALGSHRRPSVEQSDGRRSRLRRSARP